MPISSCNLAGTAEATRRSQQPSSRSYFIQTVESKPPIRPYWIPEDGLGPNRTPAFERSNQKYRVGGWEKLKQEATPSTQSSKAASLLRFSVQIKSLRASISSPKRSPSYRLTYNHNQIPNDIIIALAICISDSLILMHRYQPKGTETGSGSAPLLSACTLTIRL